MNQLNKIFISFMLVASLFFVVLIGGKTADASNLTSETTEYVHQETATENEKSENIEIHSTENQTPIIDKTKDQLKDGIVETQDWYTISTEYGTPVNNGDVTLSSVLPIDVYKNNSSYTVNYTQTHSIGYSSTWNASLDVSLDIPKLNTALNGQIGITGTKEYSFTRSFNIDLQPGKGIQIKRVYRKYSVPTYKVTRYSASMGGGTDRVLMGNTLVYVPVGMASYDY